LFTHEIAINKLGENIVFNNFKLSVYSIF